MLVQQSAAAFTLWTGLAAPLQLMQERLGEARGTPPVTESRVSVTEGDTTAGNEHDAAQMSGVAPT
jgi:hypothetical protein